MITKVNPYGHISLTNDYFSGLVEQAAKDGAVATPESARAALAGLNEFALPDRPVAKVYDAAHPRAQRRQ